jgi:hypothetical protein
MFIFSLASPTKKVGAYLHKTLQQLSLLCIIYAAGIFTPAAAIPTLSFNLPAQTVFQNDIAMVDLVISGLETSNLNLGGFDLDMTFDSNILAFTSFNFGNTLNNPFSPLTPSVQRLSLNQDTLSVSETSLRRRTTIRNSQPDSFILGTFEFLAHSIGTSLLSLSQVTLSNENGQALSFAINTGVIHVIGTDVPLPTALVLFLTILTGLFVSRKYVKQ